MAISDKFNGSGAGADNKPGKVDLYHDANLAIRDYIRGIDRPFDQMDRLASITDRMLAERRREQVAEQKRIEVERQEQYSQKIMVLITQDKSIPGYITDPYLHDLDSEARAKEWLLSRHQDHLPQLQTQCSFLDLPQSRPYFKTYNEYAASYYRGTVGDVAGKSLPDLKRVFSFYKSELVRIDMYLWGGDDGAIARRVKVCTDRNVKKSIVIDETYVDGKCRHYAAYTLTGRMLQEVYIAPDGSSQLFKPGAVERILGAVATAFGVTQKRPEQPMLQDLRMQNALSSIMVLLDRAAPDVALTVLSGSLSLRAMMEGAAGDKEALDKALHETIIPSYTRRVDLSRGLADAHNDFESALADIAQQRDAMTQLPLAQNVLDHIIATAIEDKNRYSKTIDAARLLLQNDDIRQVESRHIVKQLGAELKKIEGNPQLTAAAYRIMRTRYDELAARQDNAAELADATTAISALARRSQSDLTDYLASIRDQVSAAQIYLRSKNDADPLGSLLSPVDSSPPPGSKR